MEKNKARLSAFRITCIHRAESVIGRWFSAWTGVCHI